MFVCGEDHGGTGFTDIPDADGAVPRSRGKDVGMARVPNGGVNAISVFLECADGGGAIDGPKLDGVVPGGGEEGVTADGVVIDGVNLASVFVEGADRVSGWGEREIVELDGAVSYGSDDYGVVGFGPGDVVDSVGGVVGDKFGDWEGGV